MMRRFVIFIIGLCFLNSAIAGVQKDTLYHIKSDPQKGFFNDYLLFIPKNIHKTETTYLLIEPNNTGKLSDSITVHLAHAQYLASKSSVGNNISTELGLPLLVPVFPRLASKPLTYSHALDKDVMKEKSASLKRLDLQLLQMVEDAKERLKEWNIQTADQIFMSGFSASATFVNRFSMLHPEKIKALAIGGFNGELMLPTGKLNDQRLNYPLGTADFRKLFRQKFDLERYQKIQQYIYMGKLDDNDAVQFDDAYDEVERAIINRYKGADVQTRYINCQNMYQQYGIYPVFKSIEGVGHGTTGAMNLAVIQFFMKNM